jgi:predicted TIM-barrel fold metal-dependent hydrolase
MVADGRRHSLLRSSTCPRIADTPLEADELVDTSVITIMMIITSVITIIINHGIGMTIRNGRRRMEVIDGQLHEPSLWADYEGASPEEWHRALTESLMSSTDAVGVDGAVIMPSTDQPWAEGMAAAYPNRFAVVPRLAPMSGDGDPNGLDPEGREIDPEAPDIKEQIANIAERPGIKGLRFSISFWDEVIELWHKGRFDRALEACAEVKLPVFMFVSGALELVAPVAEKYPDLPIVIDHIGLRQRPLEVQDIPAWARLGELLALAKYPNIAVKVCAPVAMSDDGPPYQDSWAAVESMLESFGVDRLFWASDISRIRGRVGAYRFEEALVDYPGKHTYAESLAFFRDRSLSDSEKQMILGGTIRKVLDWPGEA